MASPSIRGVNDRIKPIYLILVGALLLRLGWTIFTPALPTSDFATYNSLARRVVAGLGYPDSFRVPGYPFFLATFYAIFGDHLLVVKLINVVLGALTCLFTYIIARKTFNDRVALLAALIVALFPSLILYAGLVASENLFICLLLASATLFLFSFERLKCRWFLLVASGFFLGLATLVRPLSLFLPGSWMLFLLWKRVSTKETILVTLAVSIAALATLTPWLIRNYTRAGRFVGLSTNGGITFMMGFNDRANGHYVGEVRVEFEQEARELGLDEFESNDLAYKRALRFIREKPLRAIALVPFKWAHLFRDDVSGVVWNFEVTSRRLPPALWYVLIFVSQMYYVTALALAVTGFFFLKKPYVENRMYGFPLSFIIYWLIFHAALFGDDRFHLPILPFLVIFSAFGLVKFAQTVGSRGVSFIVRSKRDHTIGTERS
jgi:4-amino-4-deoxy-L-arabinose transferase-like glycosyltransferase